MTLTVHHLQISQSERVPWLCEELGIEYELKNYKRDPMLAPADYQALHPIGAAPVIEDNGVVIAESGACLEYIAQVHGKGKLFPKPGDKNYAQFLYHWHSANGTLQPAAMRGFFLQLAGVPADSPTVQRYDERLAKEFKFLDEHLSKNKWLAGDEFTAADIMPLVTFTTLRQFMQKNLGDYPNLLRWMGDCAARPAYQKAMAKAEPGLDVQGQIKAEPPPMLPVLAPMMAQQGAGKP